MRIFEDRNALSDMRCVCLLVYLLDPTVFRSFFGLRLLLVFLVCQRKTTFISRKSQSKKD